MVLITSMEKPNNCSGCRLKDVYWEECNVTHKKIRTWLEVNDKLPEWCPLREVVSYGPEGTLYKEK